MNEGLIRLLESAARSDRGIRFVDRHEKEQLFSYSDLLERARQFGGGLQARGVRPGDRVAIVLPTSPAFFDAFFGALVAGAVPVPLYPPVRLGRLDEYHTRTAAMLRASRARIVIADGRTRRVLGRVIAAAEPELGCVTHADVEARPPKPVTRSEGDIAFIQFSSGTTVAPKPVALGTTQVLANVDAIRDAVLNAHPEPSDRPHVCVSWLPLYHDMGLIGAVMTSLSQPVELVLIPPELFIARPAVWLRTISRHRGTISLAPNFAYSLCVDRLGEDDLVGIDLSSWRVAFNGAEPVTPQVLRRFIEKFADHGFPAESLTPVYGLAEATLAATFSDFRERFTWQAFDRDQLIHEGVAIPCSDGVELVNLGRPVAGVELRIAGDDWMDLEERRIGRVLIRGRSVMLAYDGLPELTARVMRDRWLDTGDLGFLHKDELYLFGRAKDVIVLRGRNYAPQDIEQSLDDLSEVRTGCAAALGCVLDDAEGETLVVLAERSRTQGNARDMDDLADRVSRHITGKTGLTPSDVRILEPGTLPRSSSGKIRRAEARRLYLAGSLEPPRRVSAVRLLLPMLRSWWSFTRLRLAKGA